MMQDKFITIEGTEGAGKSTALQFIGNCLLNADKDFLLTREPGGSEIAEEIRKLLLFPEAKEKMAEQTELLLMFGGRAQHIQQTILPALKDGKWVISDRYIDATYAYQGGGRGIPVHQIEVLDELVVGNLYPKLTFLLDVPAEIGLERTNRRQAAKDRIEQERIDFFARVRNAYLERAKQNPERIKVIDGTQPLQDVEAQIYNVLSETIGITT